jgi:hypothetical protein
MLSISEIISSPATTRLTRHGALFPINPMALTITSASRGGKGLPSLRLAVYGVGLGFT